ncbi:MAG: alpha-glucan family phosphorylase, partial [candidate division NC10 bacterium]|nr:alpha-glucan family phosphorylase [candidate division NC10 bacterium]
SLTRLPEQVEIEIQGRPVRVQAWLHVVESPTGGRVPVLFLDTDVAENTAEDREITSYLYGGDQTYRIKQEIVLGMGGFRMLKALGVEVMKYHLNEGHASFLTLELLQVLSMDVEKVREMCVFTTHTPVDAGHDQFPYERIQELLPLAVSLETLRRLGGPDLLNMTRLALNLSDFVNGVAKRHGETTKRMFPGYDIHSITNGVHSYTWTHPRLRELYQKYLPGWAYEPQLLVRVASIPNEELWAAHGEAKKELLEYANSKRGEMEKMSPDLLTIGFARRATPYKRHDLLFSDLERLRRISRRYPFQVILAGKAHPQDEPGKQMIEAVFSQMKKLKGEIPIVYLEDYGIELAQKLVSGCDLWLNTPQRPLEASGTSGMKAAHNGVINFSVLEGWWIEGYIEGVTGWGIGPRPEEKLSPEEVYQREKEDLYAKLEYIILPMFYEQRDRWVEMMENSIGKIAYFFNSHRMMRRYITEAYFI